MTINEAYTDCPTFEQLAHSCCIACRSEWYCPTYCTVLEKAQRMPFEKIIKSYARNDGDIVRVIRYIRRYKEKPNV